jgi:CubicO group peptidase (beta-lactamase class C family)
MYFTTGVFLRFAADGNGIIRGQVDKGKITLDDRISKYFTNAPSSWTNVTVRHLLTHTAGFTGYPKDFDLHRDYTEDELFNCITAIPVAFPPGEKWSYSNLGYVTLGILIHRVTGEFYGEALLTTLN